MAPSGDGVRAMASLTLSDPVASTTTPSSIIHHRIYNNVLELIGNTPIVRLTKLPQLYGIECEMLVKCEYMSAGGSIKDRIALRMIEEAEKEGRIHPSKAVEVCKDSSSSTLIEPTSGNTGIGLALVAAVKGYNAVITMPEKMSAEKVNMLKALGATIHRTPTSVAWDSPLSHMSLASRLVKSIPDSVILDQYNNPHNPLAHYHTTAEEILVAMQSHGSCPSLDMVVMGAGTGGSVTGVSKRLKEAYPNIKVVGVDPIGSILAQPESLNVNPNAPYQVEGIGYDFVPKALDRTLVDEWVKTNDKDSFLMARQLIRLEGLLVGGSSGAAMSAAIKVARGLSRGQKILVILPDSVRNYMTKFLSDDWMIMHEYLQSPVATAIATHPKGKTFETVREWMESHGAHVVRKPISISQSSHAKNALAKMTFEKLSYLFVHDDSENIVGLVTPFLLAGKVSVAEALLPLKEATRLGLTIQMDDDGSMKALAEKLNGPCQSPATLLFDVILVERNKESAKQKGEEKEAGKVDVMKGKQSEWKVHGVISPADYHYYQYLLKENDF